MNGLVLDTHAQAVRGGFQDILVEECDDRVKLVDNISVARYFFSGHRGFAYDYVLGSKFNLCQTSFVQSAAVFLVNALWGYNSSACSFDCTRI